MSKGRKYIVISVINGHRQGLLGCVRSSSDVVETVYMTGFRITPVKDSLEKRSLTHRVPPTMVLGAGEMIKQSKRQVYS